MTLVKICGVTTPLDAAAIAHAGADFVGINFAPRSPRLISARVADIVVNAAREAATTAGSTLRVVGVYVDATAEAIGAHHAAGLIDIAQLHGDESPAFARMLVDAGVPVWKACTLPSLAAMPSAAWQAVGVGALVLDAAVTQGAVPGGTGQVIDWMQARAVIASSSLPVVLAGGLQPGNVGLAIAQAQPWCVDVASGVELAPGHKDLAKVSAFVQQARRRGTPNMP